MTRRQQRKPTIRAERTTASRNPPPPMNLQGAHEPIRLPPFATVDAHHEPGDAPCRVCGGAIPATGARYWGPWRTHEACDRLAGWEPARVAAAARALGVADLTDTDAALLAASVPCYCDTGAEPTYGGGRMRDRMRWRHVDRKALTKAVRRLPAARADAGLADAPCTAGGCAWCGVRESRGWQTSPYRWRDGSPAPFCGDCAAVWLRHDAPDSGDPLTAALAERATSVPPMSGEPPVVLVPYVNAVASGDRGMGTEEPWGYLDADVLDRVRLVAWGRHPRYGPADRRAEAAAAYAATEDARRSRSMADEAAWAAERMRGGTW